ncbi:CamS family sex pheromone protein [Bacillus massilinigeriensis]|uniref:CamS family sex pheromone protein n=1 Tax=Bacillus mediterraneensis TaxID=1805474 RepID=UPI0008F8DF81|nr:CamS family sex pheromone protein [Bacillus mediterraneensis]
MRKLFIATFSIVLLLAGCAPNFQKEEQVVQKRDKDSKEKAIIPKYKISEKYYRSIVPFEPSAARGQVVNNLNTRYDINEFETGLMRIAQNSFDTEKYVFQEGQYLKAKTVQSWLNRKLTAEQLKANAENKEEPSTEEDNVGLNPAIEGGDVAVMNKKSPIYLSHILEHDYLIKADDKGTYKLGGVVIGLALNSIHYYQKEEFGDTFEVKIPHAEMEQEGKRIAQEVVNRLRRMDELKNIPITLALFEQKSRSSVVPGNFIAYSEVDQGGSNISSWEKVKEKYVLFPSDEAKRDHRDDLVWFENFKQDVEKYFPNYNGVVGNAFYLDDQLQNISIDIPIQFYGKAEAVSFTQYATGLVMDQFPEHVSIQVSITSVNGPEALILRKPDQKEPTVHIYQ